MFNKITSLIFIFGGIKMFFSDRIVLPYSGIKVYSNEFITITSVVFLLFGFYIAHYEYKKNKF